MFRVSKSFFFEAAHQLDDAASSACVDSIHGHSYRMDVVLKSDSLESKSRMVMDFGWLKTLCSDLIGLWDHALILPASLASAYRNTPSKKIIVFPRNPTAEEMAVEAFNHISNRMVLAEVEIWVELERVRVYETSDSWAEYSK